MSAEFRIAETANFRREIREPRLGMLYPKIESYVYPQLRRNPFHGLNIKKLKGEFADFYRYRIGACRLYYMIDKEKCLVFIAGISDRKDAY